MIKKYRNALLVAAVASVTVGCGGGDGGASPLSDPNNDLISGIEGGDYNTHRALAQLLGGAFYQLINTTSTVFESVGAATDANGTMGKVIGPAISTVSDSARPTGGLAITKEVPCSKGGSFDSSINLDFEGGSSDIDLELLAKQPIDAGIRFTYRECNEPNHVSYVEDNDSSTTNAPELETDDDCNIINNVLDGIFGISLKTTTGSANNADDYSVNATIKMENYFIQRYSEGTTAKRPDVLNGLVDLSLVTDDGSSYLLSLATDITNSNASSDRPDGLFVETAFLADGEVGLDENLSLTGYDLSVNGTIRDYEIAKNQDFKVYTMENLVRANSDTTTGTLLGLLGQPSSGVLALASNSEGTSVKATVTATGLAIESVIDGVVETSECTWDQVNNNDC